MRSRFYFDFMKLAFRLRDILYSRRKVLLEVGIHPGFQVLDYGCGTGSYIRDTADLVGESGIVHALDINPFAIEAAKQIAARYELSNVNTILSDCATGLPDKSIDAVLLYDVFHDLGRPDDVLAEVHRVLKPKGALSFSDHHLDEQNILAGVTKGELFILADKGRKTYQFAARTGVREHNT